MGPPIHTNGSSPAGHDASADPGPSTSSSNGHSSSSSAQILPGSLPPHVVNSIRFVQPPGNLMYEDDREWAEHHVLGTDDGHEGTDDGTEEDGASTRRRLHARPGVAGGMRMPVEREEVVRLMLQGLRDIGYHQAADVLEAESGYHLSTAAATDFQAAILGGRWSEALALLPDLGKSVGSVSDQASFLIAQQKYLEYLEIGQQKKALGVLRNDLNRVARDSDVLHTLSSFMMCTDKDDLYERAMWDGAAGTSRRQLLEHLQAYISPQIMVPSRRLATLFDQARRHQQLSCLYHEEPESSSLYIDHRCESGQFPSVTTHVLADHTDEVWKIEWSPDGMYLASAGKDKTVVIWQLKATPKESGGTHYGVIPLLHLRDHHDPVDAMAWSPDGKTLVTGADQNVYVWNARTGEQKPKPSASSQHGDTISAIQWLPDGSEFVVSSMDCKVVFYAPNGSMLRQWSASPLQLSDFVITPDGKRIVALTTPLKRVSHNDRLKQAMSARPTEESETLGPAAAGGGGSGGGAPSVVSQPFQYATMERSIAVIRIADHEIIDWSQDLRCETTSIRISSDGRKVIVSCTPDEIQVWSIDPGLKYLRKHSGHVQGRFLIRSCFGGPKDGFVLSGSEDGHVYVWQGASQNPLEVLSGHVGVVNSVAWNPVAARRIFASCSDDNTIRIWQPPLALEDLADAVMSEDVLHNSSGDVQASGSPAEVAIEEEDKDDDGMVL
ncbi:hypothetical protein I316_06697 [Kwoniella heveanensis BCC8398]|uniref:WD-repeat protein n=1 Tax=Kwoniella heveanensis BCC8398 TaxID=1296120 RepID=A0A1B9GKU8_9TREE|nr:hypothetical protein I316_06697 [Kwoniella heveanensis BCC8398]